MEEALYDILAVNIRTNIVRVMDTGKMLKNAEACVKLAIMRRGVEEEFFIEVPSGRYKNGDKWKRPTKYAHELADGIKRK